MHSIPTTPSNRRAPRGNTIVLVTAILVLLVIIATAFVSRTRAVRQTSAAQQSAAGRDGRAESVGVNVAQEIASALFVRPIDTADPFARTDNSVTPPVVVGSASWPRLAAPLDSPRYSVDPRDLLPAASATNPFAGDGIPELGYNFAPYEVKAWTNWPDNFATGSAWPFGAGSPSGVIADAGGRPIGDENPYGSPGMGDTRWLRSTEPERVGVDQSGDGVPDLFTFSHWSHLTWLPSASNGWRVVVDISDIGNTTLQNLNENDASQSFATAIPYEQWLPHVYPNWTIAQLTQPVGTAGSFLNRRNTWFGPFNGGNNYTAAYLNPNVALPNFFRLRELGKPTDEFRAGTARNIVSRTFTDTDGDGFTDSFWFLAPVGTDRAIRTVVGVSIVDNSALLNANIATKFSFDTTIGATPSDLALVTSAGEYPPLNPNGSTVGFFDGPVNQISTNLTGVPASNLNNSPLPTYWSGSPQMSFPGGLPRFDRSRYGDAPPFTTPASYLQAIGMRTPTGGSDPGAPGLGLPLIDQTLPTGFPQGTFESALERLSWFKIAGNPEQPRFGLTPFDAADEFELRAYHGNNLPGALSRFEQAVNLFSPALYGDTANNFQFLRSSPQREESDEYLDQLDARQLLVDNRRKLTMFSGARNELAPPALWTTPFYEETRNYLNSDGAVPPVTDPNYAAFQTANRAEWNRQRFKVDLREPTYVDPATGNRAATRSAFAAFQWRRDLLRLLEKTLTATSVDGAGNTVYKSYFGDTQQAYRRTRSMIASWVANLDTASDEAITVGTTGVAVDRPLYPSAPQADPDGYYPPTTDAVPDPIVQNRFYLGMEKQPFIMEVFHGLVYPRSDFNEAEWNNLIQASGGSGTVPASVELPDGQLGVDDGGENFVDSSSKPTSIIAVQIANPYDTPLALGEFRLQYYGKTFNFTAGSLAAGYGPNPVLPPATLGKPSTAIVYAVESGVVGPYTAGQFRAAVLDFFDLEKGEMQGTVLQPTDIDQDTVLEYATLYDSQGPINDPDVDTLDRTLVFDATASWDVSDVTSPSEPNAANTRYTTAGTQPVQILRNIVPPPGVGGGPIQVVVDRFDNDQSGPGVDFNQGLDRLFSDPQFAPPQKNYNWDANPARRFIAGIRIRENEMYMTWCRSSRIWAWDVDGWDNAAQPIASRAIMAFERSPRYVFSMATEPVRPTRQWEGVSNNGARQTGAGGYKGDCWKLGQDPDGDGSGQNRWSDFTFMDMFGRQMRGKPVFFTNLVVTNPGGNEVISSLGAAPMPFLPKLGLTAAPGDVFPQDCHGIAEINGSQFEWMIGNKGCQPSDWQRFKQLVMPQVPFQMTQRDQDFDQIGEVLDVFLWGHVFEGWGGNPTTVRTFGEIMMVDDVDDEFYPGTGVMANRLWIRAPGELGTDDPGALVVGSRFDATSTTNPPAPAGGHSPWQAALPLGVGILDGLTIDGPGRNSFDRNVNGNVADAFDNARAEERTYGLAGGFGNRATPGLININTAMPEVMQTLPMLTRLSKTQQGSAPYSHFVDMIRFYRDRVPAQNQLYGAPTPFNRSLLPTYSDRGLTTPQFNAAGLGSTIGTTTPRFFPSMRGDRGFASIGELLLLNRLPDDAIPNGLRASYTSRWLGYDPYADYAAGGFGDYIVGYSWSTDRTNGRPRQLPADIYLGITPNAIAVPSKQHDEPLGDAEDMNLLVKGISNLVTTRSDVFTVYLRVRQVKQNDTNGIWDGTNREQVVDDARYVLCVDRSNVDSPDDQPRIVYFQKCP